MVRLQKAQPAPTSPGSAAAVRLPIPPRERVHHFSTPCDYYHTRREAPLRDYDLKLSQSQSVTSYIRRQATPPPERVLIEISSRSIRLSLFSEFAD